MWEISFGFVESLYSTEFIWLKAIFNFERGGDSLLYYIPTRQFGPKAEMASERKPSTGLQKSLNFLGTQI